MAAIDNDHLVVNVVYTGPPMAGKTQSVRALMPLLSGRGAEQRVLSPGDWHGRTAFFDWAEYEGGAYDGKTIRCRIISTPGQVALSDRRELLIRAADAVILVVDSRADALERALHCYEEMEPWLAESGRDVPIRLLLQCNKQDLPGSLPAEELGRVLGLPCGKDVYPTSARTGKGLRAAFVAGVRCAVERARAMVARGLVLDEPELASGEELLERMRRETAPLGSYRPGASARAPASTAAPGSTPARGAAPRAAAAQRAATTDGQPSTRGTAEARPSSAAPGSAARLGTKPPGSARPSPQPPSSPSRTAPFPFGSARPKPASGLYPTGASRALSAAKPSDGSARPAGPFSKPAGPSSRGTAPAKTSGSGLTGSVHAGNARSSAVPTHAVPSSTAPSSTAPSSPPPSGRAVPRGSPASSRSTGTSPGTPARQPTPASGGIDAGARTPRRPRSSAPPTTRSSAPAPAAGRAQQPRSPSDLRAAAPLRGPTAPVPPTRSGTDTGERPSPRLSGPPASSPLTPAAERAARAAMLERARSTGAAPVDALTLPAPARAEEDPASSNRRAVDPKRAAIEARDASAAATAAERAARRSASASLDPLGEAARAWRPGHGVRPAVLPARFYYTWVPPESEPRSGAPAAPLARADSARGEPAQPGATSGADAREAATPPVRATAPLPSSGRRLPSAVLVPGAARPAVLPASAWLAALRADASTAEAGGRQTASRATAAPAVATAAAGPDASSATSAPARRRASEAGEAGHEGAPALTHGPSSARPAILPAAAYLAARAAQREARAGSDDAALDSGSRREALAPRRAAPRRAEEADRSLDASAPAGAGGQQDRSPPSSGTHPSTRALGEAAATPEPTAPSSARPAVMPSSSYRATLARLRGARAGSVAPRADAATPPATHAGAHGARGVEALAPAERAEGSPSAKPADARAAHDASPAAHGTQPPTGTAQRVSSAAPERSASARGARARPAVMPASAYFAAMAAGQSLPTPTPIPTAAAPGGPARAALPAIDAGRPGAEGVPAEAPDRPGTHGPEPLRGTGLSEAPSGIFSVQLPLREKRWPAVMPAGGWRDWVRNEPWVAEQAAARRAWLESALAAAEAADATAGPAATDVSPSAADSTATKGAAADSAAADSSTDRAATSDASAPPRMSAWRNLVASSESPTLPASAGPRDGLARSARSTAAHAAPAPPPLRLLRGGTADGTPHDPRPAGERSAALLPRPAVMPASAWRGAATAPASGAAPAHAAAPRHVAPGAAPQRRPAVMPASAWRAGPAPAPSASPPTPPPRRGSAVTDAERRPAVMPASAWRAATGARESSARSNAAEPEPLPRVTLPSSDSWVEALATPTTDAAWTDALSTPSDGKPMNDVLEQPGSEARRTADPRQAGGHDATRAGGRPSPEEPADSFRIPEMPPGLQAFLARGWQVSALPGEGGSSSVRDAAAGLVLPAPADASDGGSADRDEVAEPVVFTGPRMPGYARVPRAVWRRRVWRSLEMHVTPDGAALEQAHGRWIGELAPGWYARTLLSVADERSARRAFAEEVRRERRLARYLSEPRCIALTEEADRYWLWQVACRVPTLAATLGRRLATRESPAMMADALLEAALGFIDARQRFGEAQVPLPLSLHALSLQGGRVVYAGLMPDPGATFIHPGGDGHAAFEDALRQKWPGVAVDGRAVLDDLQSKAAGRLPEPILEIIRAVVGHSSIETSRNEVSG